MPPTAPPTPSTAALHAHASPLVIPTPLGSLPMLEPCAMERSSSQTPASHKRRLLGHAGVFMNLLMSVIGAGMLSLPFTFAVMPAAQAAAMVLVVGASMALTAHALLRAHAHVAQTEELRSFVGAGRNVASYRSMGIRVGGARVGNAVSLVMAVGIFGGCVGGIRIARDMMPHMSALLVDSVSSGSYAALSPATQTAVETALLWSIFVLGVLPLCALKSLSGLRIPNLLGFVFSLLLIVAVVYRSSTLQPTGVAAVAIVAAEPSSAGSPFARFAQSVSIYSYAFTMHLNLLPLFVQLRGSFDKSVAQSSSRMTLCIAGVTLLCMVLYIVFGVSASRLYGANVQGNVLVNMQSDSFMQLPLVAVFLTVLLSFPPLFHPGRVIVQELIHNKPAAELGWQSRLVTTAALLLGELLVAVWVPGIEVVFALVGASTTVLICYVFPVAMFTSLYPWRERGLRGWLWCGGLWAIVAFVAVMGVRTIVFLLSSKA